MDDVKTSREVGYTASGEPGKQCRGCANYLPKDETSGSCLGHKVVAVGSCDFFKAK